VAEAALVRTEKTESTLKISAEQLTESWDTSERSAAVNKQKGTLSKQAAKNSIYILRTSRRKPKENAKENVEDEIAQDFPAFCVT